MEINFEDDEEEEEVVDQKVFGVEEDLPPNSSDEEYWEEEAKKKAVPGRMEKKSKLEAMAEKEDAPEEKKAVNVDDKGK